jgi:hypothetical protein
LWNPRVMRYQRPPSWCNSGLSSLFIFRLSHDPAFDLLPCCLVASVTRHQMIFQSLLLRMYLCLSDLFYSGTNLALAPERVELCTRHGPRSILNIHFGTEWGIFAKVTVEVSFGTADLQTRTAGQDLDVHTPRKSSLRRILSPAWSKFKLPNVGFQLLLSLATCC